MTANELHDFLRELPKCEHHMHLEGALEPDLLFELATRNKITLPSQTEDAAFASPASLLDRYDRFTSLDDFLGYYFIGMSCLIREDDFYELAKRYFLKAKAEGVRHAEVFFDPQAHTSRGVPYEFVRDGFVRACRFAEQELGISTELIVCFLRHLPVPDCEQMFETVEPDLKSKQLAGIGLDSSEKEFPPGRWKAIYQKAQATGIKRTAHAGEEGPVEYIKEALRELNVQRVDHGIKLINDSDLMHEIANKRLLVTVCPVSNVKLQCVQHVRDVPIRKFLDAGVSFSLNSDDPAYFKAYILDVYIAVQDAFHLSKEEWRTIAINSIDGSWCSEERKATLRTEVEDAMQRYPQVS